MDLELRFLEQSDLRAAPDGRIVGYAAIFHALSRPLDGTGLRERILPGAFRRSLAEGADILALVNHSPDLVLGRTKSGTLKLAEDEKGLRYDINPPDTQVARDLIVSMKRGDIDQSSFAFRVPKGGDRFIREGGQPIREILDAELRDVSVVTFPAYETSEAHVRTMLGSEEATRIGWYCGGDDVGLALDRERLRLRLRVARAR